MIVGGNEPINSYTSLPTQNEIQEIPITKNNEPKLEPEPEITEYSKLNAEKNPENDEFTQIGENPENDEFTPIGENPDVKNDEFTPIGENQDVKNVGCSCEEKSSSPPESMYKKLTNSFYGIFSGKKDSQKIGGKKNKTKTKTKKCKKIKVHKNKSNKKSKTI